MTTEWSHLPNAVHIDRIIASAKAHPEVWAAWWAEGDGARTAAAWAAAWAAAEYAARDQVWDRARDQARFAAGYAVIALIAWDHSAKFLDMAPDELKMWCALSEDSACILLLPAVVAFEKIKELALVDG